MTRYRRLREAAHSETGQAILESAITIPLLFLLFFGLIEFGRAAYTAAVVQWAAQEGARIGTIHPTQAAVTTAARGRMTGLQADQATVVFAPGADTVTVQVSYPFVFLTPLVSTGITMQGSASMVIQPALMGSSP